MLCSLNKFTLEIKNKKYHLKYNNLFNKHITKTIYILHLKTNFLTLFKLKISR